MRVNLLSSPGQRDTGSTAMATWRMRGLSRQTKEKAMNAPSAPRVPIRTAGLIGKSDRPNGSVMKTRKVSEMKPISFSTAITVVDSIQRPVCRPMS
ncbi:MAG: hypothetical protein BWZ10_03158 [candidate division BRC1 bacterium ADurb.BinA364]|nr:MAG: hypothetical protein BWZ10_03158 [candidate division BRC1 bacterium ADurb.BinA364]